MDERSFVPKTETDEYADWTDGQRLEEYRYTGDPTYLTVELAKRISVGPDVMREVLGATSEDIESARMIEEKLERKLDEQEEFFLEEFELARESLLKMSDSERAKHLLEYASTRLTDHNDTQLEHVISHSKSLLFGEVLTNHHAVVHLMHALEYENPPKTLEQLKVLEQLFENVRLMFWHYQDLAEEEVELTEHQAFEYQGTWNAIQQMTSVFEDLAARNADDSFNALLAIRLNSFARDFLKRLSPHGWIDQEELAPFKIAPGKFATFTEDKDRLRIVDESDTDIESVQELVQFEKKEEGYRILNRKTEGMEALQIASTPELSLADARFDIIDGGDRIEEIAKQESWGGNQEDMGMFVAMLRDSVRLPMGEYFGITTSDLSLREQWYLFQYLRQVTVGEANRVSQFAQVYGRNGLRTFLALEHLGDSYGDLIVKTGNSLEEFGAEEYAHDIFHHFSEMQNYIDRVPEYLSETGLSEGYAVQMSDYIRARSAQFLKNILEQPLGNSVDSYSRIVEAIARNQKDAVIFTSAFRTLKLESGQFDFERLKDTSFESIAPASLTEEDRKRMFEILERNWADESPEFLEKINAGLTQALASDENTFYVLRYKGRIVGFNRFEDRTADETNPHIYFGSFNTDPEYGNGKLGEAIYEESLKQQLVKEFPIHAACDPLSPITKKYIESGFVAVQFELYGEKPSFYIVHPNEAGVFSGPALTPEQIAEAEQETEQYGMFVRKIEKGDRFLELQNGKALTRYIVYEGTTYGVFEDIPQEKRAMLQVPRQ